MSLTVDLILSIVAALVLGGWLGWLARGARLERQSFDAQVEAYQRTIKARQAPKHARTEPRENVGRAGSPVPVLPGTSAPDHRARTEPNWTAPKRAVTRSYTDAAHIPPTIWASPGSRVPFQPQPPRTSGAGTQTLPRLTDTGELRKLEADWVEKTRREQAVWSHEFAQRCEADRKELLT